MSRAPGVTTLQSTRDLRIMEAADAGMNVVQLGANFRVPYREIARALDRTLRARADAWAASDGFASRFS